MEFTREQLGVDSQDSESYHRTLAYICKMMTNKKHLTPLPLCSDLTNQRPGNMSIFRQYVTRDSDYSQNLNHLGLLGGAFFILLILAIVTWRKGMQLEVFTFYVFRDSKEQSCRHRLNMQR